MRVIKNAAWLTVGRVAADVTSFVLFTVVSRVFGPSGTGEYSYAFALGNLVGIIAASGFEEYGIREYACSTDLERSSLWRNLLAAPALRVVAAVVCLILFLLSGLDDISRPILIVEFSLFFLGWYLSRMLFVPAMALQSMAAPALTDLACRGSAILVAIVLALCVRSLPVAVLGFPIAGAAIAAVALRNGRGHVPHARGRAPAVAAARASWGGVRTALAGSAPFAASELLNQFYARADLLLIAYWLGTAQTGLYATAIKFVEVGAIPLMLFGAAVYPVISRLAFARSPQLEASARDFTHAVFAMAGWLAIGVGFLIPLLVVPLFGAQFAPASSLLVWFGALALGKGVETALSRLLFSVRRQDFYVRALGFGTLLIVALNAALIPSFGIRGAAAAAICSSLVGDVLCVYGLRRHVRTRVFIAAGARLALALAIAIGTMQIARSLGAGPWAEATLGVLLFPLAARAVGLVPSRRGALLAGHHADERPRGDRNVQSTASSR